MRTQEMKGHNNVQGHIGDIGAEQTAMNNAQCVSGTMICDSAPPFFYLLIWILGMAPTESSEFGQEVQPLHDRAMELHDRALELASKHALTGRG